MTLPAGFKVDRTGVYRWQATTPETRGIQAFLVANGVTLGGVTSAREALTWWRVNVKPLIGKGLRA